MVAHSSSVNKSIYESDKSATRQDEMLRFDSRDDAAEDLMEDLLQPSMTDVFSGARKPQHANMMDKVESDASMAMAGMGDKIDDVRQQRVTKRD